ncbi:MAG: helix-turn-helix domain-containing protein [Rikenellaceae bacterium]
MRYVLLSENEKKQLEELYKDSDSWVIRRRCQALLLSNNGHSLAEVAKQLNIHWNTVSRLIDRWESNDADNRLSVLSTNAGQGAKLKLKPVIDILPGLVEKHDRNLKPILEILEKEHSIKVCKFTLQSFLKGTGL